MELQIMALRSARVATAFAQQVALPCTFALQPKRSALKYPLSHLYFFRDIV